MTTRSVPTNFAEIGLTGLSRSGQDVTEEWKPQLTGGQAIKVWREMTDNDPIIGAILFAIQMLIRQVDWRVQPVEIEGKESNQEVAEFLESCMNDMSMTWHDTISEIMWMLPYGWSFHEIVYKRREGLDQSDPTRRSKFSDGKIGWRKLPIRSQDTLEGWEWDDAGGLKLMKQMAPPDFESVEIPIEKGLLFRTSIHKNNPEGKSVLRNAYRPYVFKKRFEEVEGIGVERDLAGLPMAFVDPKIMLDSASPDEKAVYEKIKLLITNIRRDKQEGIIWPAVFDEKGNRIYELVLLNSGGARQYNTDAIIDRLDRRMAQSMLSDFIMLGHETVGSFALSSSKTRLFAVALGAWLDMISGVLNDIAVPRLLLLNGMDTENMPKIVHTDLEIPNLSEIADFLAKLAGVGIILDDDPTEDHLRQVAKLPPRPMGEDSMKEEIREARRQAELEELERGPEAGKQTLEQGEVSIEVSRAELEANRNGQEGT